MAGPDGGRFADYRLQRAAAHLSYRGPRILLGPPPVPGGTRSGEILNSSKGSEKV